MKNVKALREAIQGYLAEDQLNDVMSAFADFLRTIELPEYSADSDRALDDFKYRQSARYSDYDLALHKDELLAKVRATINRVIEELKSNE